MTSSAGARRRERRRGPGTPRPGGQPRRRALVALLTAGVVVGLVVLAVAKIDLAEVGHLIARINGWWVAAAVALMALAFVLRGESWHTVVRAALPDVPLSRMVVTRILFIGMAVSTLAPGRVGEAARAYLIARRAGGMRKSMAIAVGTLLAQTLLNVLALLLLTGVAVTGSAIQGANSGSLVETAGVPALVVLILVGAPYLGAHPESIRFAPLRRLAVWIQRQLMGVRRGLNAFRRPRTAVHSGVFQLAAWGSQLAMCYVVLRAFDLPGRAGLGAAAAVLVAVNITAIVPITPSNIGVFQAACIAVLAPFGISASEGLAYGLVLQAVEIVCALGLGLPSLLREGVSISELRGHPDQVSEAPTRA